ncbi:MAG TPA: LysR family transcriptional regulator [Microbacterium sp.]|nr:LysR family transcriptional regulator [Microbacterium sp.]
MPDLGLWRTFLAVHRTGSLSAAARMVGVTQPAVSAQLQALERTVGEQLFVRGARGVAPTVRANELAGRLAGPFDLLAAALTQADPASAAEQPPVRLGGAAELLGEVVAPALAPLIADGVRVNVTPGMPGPLVDALRAGTLDLVIASERPRGRALVAAPLVDETFVLVVSPDIARELDSSEARQGADGAPLLDSIALLAYSDGVPILRRYWRHVFGRRLEREAALTFPALRALRDAAIAGAGVTALPSYLCRAALDSGALVEIFPTVDPPINTLWLVRRPGAAIRPHVERVAGVLTGTVAQIVGAS